MRLRFPRVKLDYGETDDLICILDKELERLVELMHTGTGMSAINADNRHSEVYRLRAKLLEQQRNVQRYYYK